MIPKTIDIDDVLQTIFTHKLHAHLCKSGVIPPSDVLRFMSETYDQWAIYFEEYDESSAFDTVENLWEIEQDYIAEQDK